METQTINNNQELLSSIKEANSMLHTLFQKNAEGEKKYDALVEKTRNELSSQIADIVADVQKFKASQAISNLEIGNPNDKKSIESLKSLSSFVRRGEVKGIINPSSELNILFERKDMSVANAEAGGYLVVSPFGEVAMALERNQSPLKQYAMVKSFSQGDHYPISRNFNNASARFGAEGASNTATEATYGEVKVVANELTAETPVSLKLLEDGYAGVEADVIGQLYAAFEEAESDAFINGDGVAAPRGILTYGTQATEVNTVAKNFYTVNSGAAAAYTKAGLTSLQMGLKRRYHTDAKWFCSRSAFGEILRISDLENFQMYPYKAAENGDTLSLFGKEIIILEHMPTLAANSKSLMYGAMNKAYCVAEKPTLSILRNPYRLANNMIYQGRKRVGGDVVAFDALVIQTTAV